MRHLRLLFALVLATLLAGCAGFMGSAPPPRLVVMVVIDGLPQRQVLGYRDQLALDGFARFLDRGAWFAEAHHGHGITATAPGHSVMLTGTSPSRTGIINNEWRDRETGDTVYNTGDTAFSYIGHRTRPLDGTSPRNLKVDTVGDMLRRADPRARVLAISGKDRGAILPAGHAGTAYMYMGETGQFASSTYYMKEHPAWVGAFHAARPADRFFKTEWKPLLAEEAYARSIPDRQPYYGKAAGGLPMLFGAPSDDAPGPSFYGSLLTGPFGDQLALDFARAAIAGEQLGADDVPDILVVSLSGHDYVNHRYGAESRISHDHFLQLDRMLQAFFQHLDQAVGRDRWMAVLTSDHGFMPAPEVSGQGGRWDSRPVVRRVNADLEKQFGAAGLVRFISAYSAFVLDRKLIADKGLDFDAVAEAARASLLVDPVVAVAFTRRELETNSRAGAPLFESMRRAWHKDVSGDVHFALKPYWISGTGSGYLTSHGSPHPYDSQVPLAFWGPAWVQAGRIDGRVETIDLAPTLARVLRVAPPATSEGKPLPLAAR